MDPSTVPGTREEPHVCELPPVSLLALRSIRSVVHSVMICQARSWSRGSGCWGQGHIQRSSAAQGVPSP